MKFRFLEDTADVLRESDDTFNIYLVLYVNFMCTYVCMSLCVYTHTHFSTTFYLFVVSNFLNDDQLAAAFSGQNAFCPQGGDIATLFFPFSLPNDYKLFLFHMQISYDLSLNEQPLHNNSDYTGFSSILPKCKPDRDGNRTACVFKQYLSTYLIWPLGKSLNLFY